MPYPWAGEEGLRAGKRWRFGNRAYHSQHCFYHLAGFNPTCMEGGMTGSKIDSIALWVLLMPGDHGSLGAGIARPDAV